MSRSEGSEHLGGYFETLHTCLIRVSPEYNRMFMEELSREAKEATFNRANGEQCFIHCLGHIARALHFYTFSP